MRGMSLAAALIWLLCAPSAFAQQAARNTEEAYAPYAWLIGAWGSDGGAITQSFRWGPGRSYIEYSTTTRDANGADHLHLAGTLLYNPETQRLDFLIALEPGSLEMERGSMHAEPDGAIVREVELVGPGGVHGRFRQTFRMRGEGVGETSLMRDDGHGGWAPRFPGSDEIEMRRIGF